MRSDVACIEQATNEIDQQKHIKPKERPLESIPKSPVHINDSLLVMDESLYVPEYEVQIIAHLFELETKNVLTRKFLDLASDKVKEKRGIMVNFFVKTKTKFKLNKEVL
ncbi:Cyclin [Brachionus plicatilis]|uniref:Cyclin n=1 Tax=Brachionus plicatilis TaxID=10195 RepID=A0A3M7QE96_BRAPC|nr:Cyclin [Brachionus plicatilis]